LTFRHYKGGTSPTKRTGRLYPRRNPWYSLSEAESTSGHMVLSGVPQKKSPVTPSGIDPGTVRQVAQRLNHYATPGPASTAVSCPNLHTLRQFLPAPSSFTTSNHYHSAQIGYAVNKTSLNERKKNALKQNSHKIKRCQVSLQLHLHTYIHTYIHTINQSLLRSMPSSSVLQSRCRRRHTILTLSIT